jgi:pilus assembly protein CpaE
VRGTGKEPELAALLIAPDRELARQLASTLGETRTFQVLSELKAYPLEQTLELRLRQLQPEVVLVDVASDWEAAAAVIRQAVAAQPAVYVVALHRSNDPEVLIRALRTGAHEFLYAPFGAAAQKEAAARIRRLKEPENTPAPEVGHVVVFSSCKPGSGATTLAIQTAFSLRRLTGQRVLLADFDVLGGSIAFALKLNTTYNLLDALERSDSLDPGLWSALTVNHGGVDILPAPEISPGDHVEPNRLHDLLEYARLIYDWVVIDLPSVFHRLSLFALSEADQSLLVSTSELPSLHLARRAVGMLGSLGFGKDRFQMVINRCSRKEGISGSDIEKIFGCPVFAQFPNDYYALHRVVTRAEPLAGDCDLGKSIETLSRRIAGLAQKEKTPAPALLEQKPALSQT